MAQSTRPTGLERPDRLALLRQLAALRDSGSDAASEMATVRDQVVQVWSDLGLLPAHGDAASFAVRSEWLGIEKPAVRIKSAAIDIELEADTEYFVAAPATSGVFSASGNVVFIGHGGAVAPPADRVVMVLASPADRVTGGPTEPDIGEIERRLEVARRGGARAAIVVWSAERDGGQWESIRSRFGRRPRPAGVGGSAMPMVFLPWDIGRILVSNSPGGNLALIANRASRSDFEPLDLGVHIDVSFVSRSEALESGVLTARLNGQSLPHHDRPIVLRAAVRATRVRPASGEVGLSGAAETSNVAVSLLVARALAADKGRLTRSVHFIVDLADDPISAPIGAWVAGTSVLPERLSALIDLVAPGPGEPTTDIVLQAPPGDLAAARLRWAMADSGRLVTMEGDVGVDDALTGPWRTGLPTCRFLPGRRSVAGADTDPWQGRAEWLERRAATRQADHDAAWPFAAGVADLHLLIDAVWRLASVREP